MLFYEKLNLLMAFLGISNSRLARVLAVDASLISRWRKGTRGPGKNSAYIKAIARFISGQAIKDKRLPALCEIIGIPASEAPQDQPRLEELILKWLTSEVAVTAELAEGFIDRLGMFGSQKKAPPLFKATRDIAIERQPPLEVFMGIKGKQEGVIRFLILAASAMKPGNEILAYSDESIEWFTGDRNYLAEFIAHLFDLIGRGNRIKVVHVVSRDLAEMLAAIDFWLPFYMTGAIEPYYCPRYREHFFRRTLFIAPGITALTCNSLAGQEGIAPNYLHTDPDIVECLHKEFNEFLKSCRPLMRIFTSNTPAGVIELVAEFAEQPGDCTRLLNTLSLATMPGESFSRILERHGIQGAEKENLLALHKKMAGVFLENLKHRRYTEIVSLPLPGEVAAGHIPVEMPGHFGSPFLFYDEREFAGHLEHINFLLKTQQNYRFFINERTPYPNIHISVIDEIGVVVEKTNNPRVLFAFNQQNMTNAFCYYLKEISGRLPRNNCDRQEVSETINGLIKNLATMP